MAKFLKIIDIAIWLIAFLFFVWSIGAIYYWPWFPVQINILLLLAYLAIVARLLWKTESNWSGRSTILACSVAVFICTIMIRPSKDRIWAKDHQKVADVEISNGLVTINNFRNSVYRTELDYDPVFESRQFPLESLNSVWLIVQKFTASEGLAHVFLSFGLKPGNDLDFFSISVEIRREERESYSPIRGLYRTYELTHVIGDECDLIGVRTVHRLNDRVFMYRINASEKQTQELFLQFAKRIESLRETPQFYHSLLNNCANGITGLTYELTPEPINWLDPRIVLPGYSGQFAFEHGLIGNRKKTPTFESLAAKSRIDLLARQHGIAKGFSEAIRPRVESAKD